MTVKPSSLIIDELNSYYLKQDEPLRGCLLALRDIILAQSEDVRADWKYGMPFFFFRGKRFCYLWIHKKFKQPYLGLVEGKIFYDPELLTEGRSRMKILLVNPDEDIPVEKIRMLLGQAIAHCSVQ